ncbi:MAG: glycosyltransferase, partial [Pseudomonadota bacterium]
LESGEFCARQAESDSRIRICRSDRPMGFVESCMLGWAAAKGEYFLWCDADTWLDKDYLKQGIGFLSGSPGHVLAFGGVVRADGTTIGTPISVAYEDSARRVELLLTTMTGGEAWYGVHRRPSLETMELRNGLGFYYGWLSSVAWRGRIAVVPEMTLRRDRLLDDCDANEEVGRLGLGNFQATDRWLAVAALLFCSIAFFDDALDRLPFVERIRLAAAAADAIANSHKVLDEGMMISFASRLFPDAHIVERFRTMRTTLADAVMRLPGLSSTDPFAQNLVGTINVLCRMRIGNIPMTKEDRDIVRQLEDMWDRDKKIGSQNKVAIVSAMYL